MHVESGVIELAVLVCDFSLTTYGVASMSGQNDSAAKQIFVGVAVAVLSGALLAWLGLSGDSPFKQSSPSDRPTQQSANWNCYAPSGRLMTTASYDRTGESIPLGEENVPLQCRQE